MHWSGIPRQSCAHNIHYVAPFRYVLSLFKLLAGSAERVCTGWAGCSVELSLESRFRVPGDVQLESGRDDPQGFLHVGPQAAGPGRPSQRTPVAPAAIGRTGDSGHHRVVFRVHLDHLRLGEVSRRGDRRAASELPPPPAGIGRNATWQRRGLETGVGPAVLATSSADGRSPTRRIAGTRGRRLRGADRRGERRLCSQRPHSRRRRPAFWGADRCGGRSTSTSTFCSAVPEGDERSVLFATIDENGEPDAGRRQRRGPPHQKRPTSGSATARWRTWISQSEDIESPSPPSTRTPSTNESSPTCSGQGGPGER